MTSKLWTEEDQRLAERAMSRTEDAPIPCRCGHFDFEHSIGGGVCWATVWRVYMDTQGRESRPLPDYCECREFDPRSGA